LERKDVSSPFATVLVLYSMDNSVDYCHTVGHVLEISPTINTTYILEIDN
jgi:hypothetical protein